MLRPGDLLAIDLGAGAGFVQHDEPQEADAPLDLVEGDVVELPPLLQERDDVHRVEGVGDHPTMTLCPHVM